jgi:hypothetical protein
VTVSLRTIDCKHGVCQEILEQFSVGMSILVEPARRGDSSENPAFAAFLYRGDAHALHDHHQGHQRV